MAVFIPYSLAIIAFIFGIVTANEWVHKAVSTPFVVTIVIVPFVSVALAFGLQIIALLRDSKEREEKSREIAKFLNALDRSHGGSIIRRNFFGYLLDQWDVQMLKISQGIVTVQDEYWSVCTELFGLATKAVECTSSIPLSYWDPIYGNQELLRYKDKQVECLIKRNISVRRTFILDSILPSPELKQFLYIAIAQLGDGFCVYYIDLSSIVAKELKQLLSSDFSLIDSSVLMLGRQSDVNKGVYYYDFFELALSSISPSLHAPALALMENKPAFFGGAAPKLYIGTHRKRIDKIPALDQPGYLAEKLAIISLVKPLKCWCEDN